MSVVSERVASGSDFCAEQAVGNDGFADNVSCGINLLLPRLSAPLIGIPIQNALFVACGLATLPMTAHVFGLLLSALGHLLCTGFPSRPQHLPNVD